MNKRWIIKTLVLAVITIPLFWFEDIDVSARSVVNSNIEYELDDDTLTATLSDGKNSELNFEVPSEITDKKKVYTVRCIGEKAFYGSNIEGVILPDSVEIIEADAFAFCSNLKAISLGENLKKIDDEAFFWSGLNSIKVPDHVSYIGDNVFGKCTKLVSAEVLGGSNYMGESLFEGCVLLSSVVLPESLIEIPDKMFYGCEKLSEIDIPNTVELIGESAFGHCIFSKLSLPENLKIIEKNAFEYCSEISYIYLPDSVTTVGDYAFARCENLTCIEIPVALQSIGYHAFGGGESDELTRLKKVICVKNSLVDKAKPFFFWTQYGITYPEFFYKVSGDSVSGSIFGQYSLMAYVGVAVILIAAFLVVVLIFKKNRSDDSVDM